MKIFIGSDHAGFELKADLVQFLKTRSIDVVDVGADSSVSCDYPIFAQKVASEMQRNTGSLGVLVCGSGVGMSIAANKFAGVRAACVSEEKSAALSRQHNDANILCLGARIISAEKAKDCLLAFLDAKFESTHPRHQRRLDLIKGFEKNEPE
jgi:ribose 5-phosphate isomerase B